MPSRRRAAQRQQVIDVLTAIDELYDVVGGHGQHLAVLRGEMATMQAKVIGLTKVMQKVLGGTTAMKALMAMKAKKATGTMKATKAAMKAMKAMKAKKAMEPMKALKTIKAKKAMRA